MPKVTSLKEMRAEGKTAKVLTARGGVFNGKNKHPKIAIGGLWLEEMGFKPQKKIRIRVIGDNIVIQKEIGRCIVR